MSPVGASDASPGTRLQLEVIAGNAAGSTIEIAERLVFGRQTEGEGQLGNDPELSRHHAEIALLGPGDYQLRDLSSTNGTHLNGARLGEPVALAVGDEIELGTTKLVVRAVLAPSPPAPEPPAVDVRAATAITDVPAAIREPAQPPPMPPPEPAPPPTPPPPSPPLDLHLKVDLERAEAEISLGEGQAVRMRLQEGYWQIATESPGE